MSDPYARYTRLRFDRPHPRVLRITMDNGRMNTADNAMHGELADIWRDVDRDASVNAVILTGAGKVFSAGGDFGMINEAITDFDSRVRQWKEARDIVYNVINFSKPVVSSMRGVAVGRRRSGLRHPGRHFDRNEGLPHHRRPPRASASRRAITRRSSGRCYAGMAKAKMYLLLCDEVLGEEAERIGLISLVVDEADLDAKALEIATRLAEGAQSAIRFTKFALNNWLRAAGPTFDALLRAGVPELQRPGRERGPRLAHREAQACLSPDIAGLNSGAKNPSSPAGKGWDKPS